MLILLTILFPGSCDCFGLVLRPVDAPSVEKITVQCSMKLDMDEVKDSILSYVSGLDVT